MINMTPSCNLCGHNVFDTIEEHSPPFRVLRCLSCRLAFVHPFPDPSLLSEHYDGDYYRAWTGLQRTARRRMWSRRAARIERFVKGGKLLDVGCGEGAFLELARERDWQVSGTELSPFAAEYIAERSGIKVFGGELYDADIEDDGFDVVTLWHVLEHVRDPLRYLQEAKRILKKEGLLVIAVPNLHDYLMQAIYLLVKGKRLKLFSPSDRELHLYHFSASTLTAIIQKAGFDCFYLGPDFGIIQPAKKIINGLATIPYYLGGWKIFNALEAFARPRITADV